MAVPPSLMAMLSANDDGSGTMAPFVPPEAAGGAVRHDLEQLEDLYSKPSMKDFKRKRRRTQRERKRKTFKDKSGALTYELERVMGEANMAYALGNQAAAIEHATKVRERLCPRAGHSGSIAIAAALTARRRLACRSSRKCPRTPPAGRCSARSTRN